MAKRIRTHPTEEQEQIALFQCVNLHRKQYPQLHLFFHIKNQGTTWSWREYHRAKALGTLAGIPDLFLPYANHGYHGWFCELKAKGGRPTSAQQQTIKSLQERGYYASVITGWEAVWKNLMWYIQ